MTGKGGGTAAKSIKSPYSDGLIEKTGSGKSVKYPITQKGEAARTPGHR